MIKINVGSTILRLMTNGSVICWLVVMAICSLGMLVAPVKCQNEHRCCRTCYEEWVSLQLTSSDKVTLVRQLLVYQLFVIFFTFMIYRKLLFVWIIPWVPSTPVCMLLVLATRAHLGSPFSIITVFTINIHCRPEHFSTSHFRHRLVHR